MAKVINTNYSEKEKTIINNYKLNKNDEIILEKLYKINKVKPYIKYIRDIYILFNNNYTPKEIGKLFNKSTRWCQLLIKECGLSRNRYEAQAIAKNKRDYRKIRLKTKETALNRYYKTTILGSKIEQFSREFINVYLQNKLNNCEIIVGLNSSCNCCCEIDIPVIIIKNTTILKFAIEINGISFHKNLLKEENKKDKIRSAGYIVYQIYSKAYVDSKEKLIYKNELIENLNCICNNIFIITQKTT